MKTVERRFNEPTSNWSGSPEQAERLCEAAGIEPEPAVATDAKAALLCMEKVSQWPGISASLEYTFARSLSIAGIYEPDGESYRWQCSVYIYPQAAGGRGQWVFGFDARPAAAICAALWQLLKALEVDP